jgi:hypothetical protein
MVGTPVVNEKDKRIGIVSSLLVLFVIFLFLMLKTFQMADPPPRDPIVKVETSIEEIILKNLRMEPGGSGSGTPSDDPVVKQPKPQTEKIITKTKNPETKVNTGESNKQTAPKSDNAPTTTQEAPNPFGDGGSGGGTGGGKGKTFGQDAGTGQASGKASSEGEGRIRLNDPSVDNIISDENHVINLKLTINSDGSVIDVRNIASKTTTTDLRIINQVIIAVKNQVKYSKKTGSASEIVYLTVRINAT